MAKISIKEVKSYRPSGQSVTQYPVGSNTIMAVTAIEQDGVSIPGVLHTVIDPTRKTVSSRKFYAIDGSVFFLHAEKPLQDVKKGYRTTK